MKESTRRRPELESLETMLLLSTMAAQAQTHHAAPNAPASNLALVGTFHTANIHPKAVPAKVEAVLKSIGLVGQGLPPISQLPGSGTLARLGSTKLALETTPGLSESIIGLFNKHSYVALATQIALPTPGHPTTAGYEIIDGNDNLATELKPTGTISRAVAMLKGQSSYTIKLS